MGKDHALPFQVEPDAGLYLRPTALMCGADAQAALAAGQALALAGVGAFGAAMVYGRAAHGTEVRRFWAPASVLRDWMQTLASHHRRRLEGMLDALAAPRPLPVPFEASLVAQATAQRRPRVMGIVNVTPDSFSGDGLNGEAAVAHGRRLVDEGADMLDIGGESTRPGARPITTTQELDRVLPVIAGLKDCGVPISIDSRHAVVMEATLNAGADMVNDVSALEHDARAMAVVAGAQVPVVLMHTRGDPRTMQKGPVYDDVLLDVYDYLERRIEACVETGIERRRILIDPGIGFGKTVAHNLALIDGLAMFHGLGCPVLLGVSRKSFIGAISGEADAKARLPGSLAAALVGADRGVAVLRVHDVAATVQALEIRAA